MRCLAILIIVIASFLFGIPNAKSEEQTQGEADDCERMIVIDVGHTPKAPGAISSSGASEYDLNWRMSEELASVMREGGWSVSFLVKRGEDIRLRDRARRISLLTRGILVSIHHDSVQEQFLQRKHTSRLPGRVSYYARGHSLFIKTVGSAYSKSLDVARAIGEQLSSTGLTPSQHHGEKIAGESRRIVDGRLGIYEFNGLAVLKASHVPAVLLEVAVIVNPLDEAWISKKKNRQKFAGAVLKGLDATCP